MIANHPEREQIRLENVLTALGNPLRLAVVRRLAAGGEHACGTLVQGLSKSTLTHHWRVLRESGVIWQRPCGRGVEHDFHPARRKRPDSGESLLAIVFQLKARQRHIIRKCLQDFVAGQRVVRAAVHDDAVLSLLVDEDPGDAGMLLRVG